jgi:hypothetical protein
MSLKTELININQVKANPNNPRTIKDEKFTKLVKSITDFPKMLELRPIIVNDDMIVLGGNMRLKACKEAGLKKIPVIKASDLTPEQQKEFIIKDNVGYGDWDWQVIQTEFPEAEEWGLDIISMPTGDINLDDFFEDNGDSEKEQKFKIVLEYTEEDYNKVVDAFGKHSGSRENVVVKLLKIE